MLRVRLKEVIEAYEARTGKRMTYEQLASATGISRATIESLASRTDYNTTLATISKVCDALGCAPGELLEMTPDED